MDVFYTRSNESPVFVQQNGRVINFVSVRDELYKSVNIFNLKVKFIIPEGMFGLVLPGIVLLRNIVGIIDSDYRGELGLISVNSEINLRKGDILASMIVIPYVNVKNAVHGTKYSAGYDLTMKYISRNRLITFNEEISSPKDTIGIIVPRSSSGRDGFRISKVFRGNLPTNIKFNFINKMNDNVNVGDRIAQVVFIPILNVLRNEALDRDMLIVDDLNYSFTEEEKPVSGDWIIKVDFKYNSLSLNNMTEREFDSYVENEEDNLRLGGGFGSTGR